MVFGMGFARAFNQVGFFEQAELTDLATNSGGSWFLAPLVYNPDFYEHVVNSTDDGFFEYVKSLVEGMDHIVAGALGSKLGNPLLKAFTMHVKGMGSILSGALGSKMGNPLLKAVEAADDAGAIGQMANFAKASSTTNYDWMKVMRNMMGNTPGLANPNFYETTIANQVSRATLKGPSLHFGATLLTSAYLEGESSSGHSKLYQTYLLDQSGRPLVNQGGGKLVGIPLDYIVPGETTRGTASVGFHAPASSLYDYTPVSVGIEVSQVQWYNPNKATDRTMPWPALPAEVSVASIAAISGAAAGLMGSPQMLKQFITENFGGAKFFLIGQIMPSGLEDLSVCSTPSSDEKGKSACPNPASRFADGGFCDNSATVQTVAHMQRQYNADRLRLVLTGYVMKNPTKSDWTSASDMRDISVLFAKVTTVAPGQMMPAAETPATQGVSRPSPQIFAAEFASIAWSDVSGPGSSEHYNQKTATLTTTTVSNPAYGVVEGTTVDIILFVVGSSLSCLQAGFSKEYAEAAAKVAASDAARLLQMWLA